MSNSNTQSPRITRARKRAAEGPSSSVVQEPEKKTVTRPFMQSITTRTSGNSAPIAESSEQTTRSTSQKAELADKDPRRKGSTRLARQKTVESTRQAASTRPQKQTTAKKTLQLSKSKAARRGVTPRKMSDSPMHKDEDLNPLEQRLKEYKQGEEMSKILSIRKCQDLRKNFKNTCDVTKRETQKLEQERAAKKLVGTTRSGNVRGAVNRPVYSDGKWINKGIDDSQDKFDEAELEYLEKMVDKVKEVQDLKFEHIKYLVIDVFLDELKNIKAGETKSQFHDDYHRLKGKSRLELFTEVRTSLFTNEQRDYIDGLLQGAFDTTSRDANGDIKHSDMNYVSLVMLAEINIRIVKHVHKLKTNEEAAAFMKRSSRQALGFDEDNDDY